MIKIGDKKGLEMAINTIVLIILALVVLIAAIFIFSRSSSAFADKINSFISSSNVDSTIDSCNILANQESRFDYCCVKKSVKISRSEILNVTCSEATEKSWAKDIQKLNCEGVC